jgi:hypothetical protein
LEVVLKGWFSLIVAGWKRVVVKEKLKKLKGVFKKWN